MSLAHIGAQIEEDNRAVVLAQTFGHLAPQQDSVYSGYIVLAHSGYGDGSVIIEAEFGDLPDSPWFYDGMNEFILDHADELGQERFGRVFRWTGTYEFRNWAEELDEEGEILREGGHEHLFKGSFVEIEVRPCT